LIVFGTEMSKAAAQLRFGILGSCQRVTEIDYGCQKRSGSDLCLPGAGIGIGIGISVIGTFQPSEASV